MAYIKGMETRDKRVIIPLNQAEVDAIDTWRFDNRMPSRAEAIREMLRRALEFDRRNHHGAIAHRELVDQALGKAE